jgi:hypothetical protein
MSMAMAADGGVPAETTTEAEALVRRSPGARRSMAETVLQVARQSGIGPFRQYLRLLSLARNGITGKEFYAHQVYLPELDRAERRAFVGEKGNFRLNLELSPPLMTHMRGFIADKIAFTAALNRLGVPATRAQAALSRHRRLGQMPVLRNEQELLQFLRSEARYPLFGKPSDMLQAIGSVGIRSVDAEQDRAELMNGTTASLAALAKEIAESYPDGFVFEDAIEQHPEITALVGPAVASLRVCTVMTEEEPEALYAIWKLPSPTGMSDNFWQAGTMIAYPDQDTGAIVQCRRGTGPDTEWIEAHPASGQRLTGFRIPHFEAAKALAVSAHAIFPINGVLGWDIAIGPDGPLIIECNENPAHQLYQFATGRGIRNAEFEPVFQRVIARAKRKRKEFRAQQKRLGRSM